MEEFDNEVTILNWHFKCMEIKICKDYLKKPVMRVLLS